MTPAPNVYIGCAGWGISSVYSAHPSLPQTGTHLQRYSDVLSTVEINSSFYRSHKPETYARWRNTTPASFRFVVKIPREITHYRKLVGIDDVVDRFIGEVTQLREKLGILLLQLPPKLNFDKVNASGFFKLIAARTKVKIVCEPRHPSWFENNATELFANNNITRVIADPPINGIGQAAPPRSDLVYLRLHGSPEIYRSAYSEIFLEELRRWIALQLDAGLKVWCIFDNTANGAAFGNALDLQLRFDRQTCLSSNE